MINDSYDYRTNCNWTPLSPITIIYHITENVTPSWLGEGGQNITRTSPNMSKVTRGLPKNYEHHSKITLDDHVKFSEDN